METIVLPISENGFLQQNAKGIFSKTFKNSTLNIALTFTKDKEANWLLEGHCTLANHHHYPHFIPSKKLILGKFYYIGSWKLHIDYFDSNINLDPAIPENKLDLLANCNLIEISVVPNGLLIKSDYLEGTIRLN